MQIDYDVFIKIIELISHRKHIFMINEYDVAWLDLTASRDRAQLFVKFI